MGQGGEDRRQGPTIVERPANGDRRLQMGDGTLPVTPEVGREGEKVERFRDTGPIIERFEYRQRPSVELLTPLRLVQVDEPVAEPVEAAGMALRIAHLFGECQCLMEKVAG